MELLVSQLLLQRPGGEIPQADLWAPKVAKMLLDAAYPNCCRCLSHALDNIAIIDITTVFRIKNKGLKVFKPAMEKLIFWSNVTLTFLIISFGPILGVIAAGLIFGKC